jgi:hypothetical protein
MGICGKMGSKLNIETEIAMQFPLGTKAQK